MKVCFYRTEDNARRVALIGEPGRKYIPICYLDSPIRLSKVPLSEARYMTDTDIKPTVTARAFLKAGKRLGFSSKKVKQWLRKATRKTVT